MSDNVPAPGAPTLGQYASTQPATHGPLPEYQNTAATPAYPGVQAPSPAAAGVAPAAPTQAPAQAQDQAAPVIPFPTPAAPAPSVVPTPPVAPVAPAAADKPADSTISELQKQLAEMRSQQEAEARRRQYALPEDVASAYEPAELEAIKSVVREVLVTEGADILDLDTAVNSAVAKVAVPASASQPASNTAATYPTQAPAAAPSPSLDAVEAALRQAYGIGIQDLRQLPGYAQFANQMHNGQMVSEHLAQMAYAGDTAQFLQWVGPIIEAHKAAQTPPAPVVAPSMAQVPGYVPNPAGAVAPPADPNTMVFDSTKIQPLLDKAAAQGMSALTDQEKQVLDSFETASYEGRVT